MRCFLTPSAAVQAAQPSPVDGYCGGGSTSRARLMRYAGALGCKIWPSEAEIHGSGLRALLATSSRAYSEKAAALAEAHRAGCDRGWQSGGSRPWRESRSSVEIIAKMENAGSGENGVIRAHPRGLGEDFLGVLAGRTFVRVDGVLVSGVEGDASPGVQVMKVITWSGW